MKDSIVTGLDIGSSAIRVVVGQIFSDGAERKLQIIGTAETPSEGVVKGSFSSIETAPNAIVNCLEQAERISGIPLDSAWVGISGTHIIASASKGVVAIGKVNGDISRPDMDRAIEAARAIATPPNYEILHVIPRCATIDGQLTMKDPVGMTGTRLEADVYIIQAFSSEIRNFTKVIYRTGLEIEDLVFSILATAEAVLTAKQKEIGVLLVNIGAATTALAVYEDGDILHSAVLPIGSDRITADIAIGLQVSIDIAEKIKLEYGSVACKESSRKTEIRLADIQEGEEGSISQKYLSQIIEARVEEIFDKIDLELRKIGRNALLPGGVVLTGGGSKLPGIVDLAKKRLKLPGTHAMLKNLLHQMEKQTDQSFTTAIGLAYWGFEVQQHKQKHSRFSFQNAAHSDVPGRVKKWFKSLLP